MIPIEDRVRMAIQDTAREIRPAAPPPLTLPQRHRRWSWRPVWRAWAIPVGAVCLAVAVVVAGLSFITSPRTGLQLKDTAPAAPPPAPSQTGATSLPAYYVALTSADGKAPSINPETTTATVRATATGKVLATIAVPRPYHAFTGVTAAADDHTFVLVAAKAGDPKSGLAPPARYYLLHFDPDSLTAAGRVWLQALPVAWIPAGSLALAMALSANGTSLAAVVGTSRSSKLYVYQLPKGHPRVWSWSACSNCSGDGIGSAPSWAADGRTVAFLFFFSPGPGIGIRLLDTHAAGTGLLTDSKLAIPVADDSSPVWQQVIITPDGRTVFAVLENEPLGQHYNQQLVRFSVATGQRTAVLNQPPIGNHFEHIQWTSPTGDTLLISGVQKGGGAGVLRNGRYTPIPWSSNIFAAAW